MADFKQLLHDIRFINVVQHCLFTCSERDGETCAGCYHLGNGRELESESCERQRTLRACNDGQRILNKLTSLQITANVQACLHDRKEVPHTSLRKRFTSLCIVELGDRTLRTHASKLAATNSNLGFLGKCSIYPSCLVDCQPPPTTRITDPYLSR